MCEIRRWWSHDESSRVGNLLYLRMRYIRSGLVLVRMNLVLSFILVKFCKNRVSWVVVGGKSVIVVTF